MLDQFGFLWQEGAGLEQDIVGHADLADIVQEGGYFELLALDFRHFAMVGPAANFQGHA